MLELEDMDALLLTEEEMLLFATILDNDSV
jgi:hypothetical protein